jgi:iron complex transport system substrate-binding protein
VFVHEYKLEAEERKHVLNKFVKTLRGLGVGLGVVLLAGCGHAAAQKTPPVSHALSIVDDTGRTVTLSGPATRIVTIAPSNTEIALDLGLRKNIVGADAMSFEYTPAPWSRELKGLHNIGPSFPAVSIERIIATKPNLVLAIPGVKGLSQLQHFHIPVIILSPQNIQGVYHDIQIVGRATGRTRQANQVVAHLQAQFARLQQLVHKEVRHKPTVFLDLGQLYSAGTDSYLNNLITMAGGQNIAAQFTHSAYPELTAEQVVKANPVDIVYDPSDASQHAITTLPGFSHVRAVRNHHVIAMTQPSYIDQPSPALAMGLAELIHLLHPHVVLPHDLSQAS